MKFYIERHDDGTKTYHFQGGAFLPSVLWLIGVLTVLTYTLKGLTAIVRYVR